jgi:2'-5' RNA ligase
MRTFIAINLDPEIKRNLTQLIDELKTRCAESRSIRWVRPEGMHLTIKFLGEIGEDKIPLIESALKRISEKYSSFSLKIKGTGYFPPKSKAPRVFWVGIEEEGILQKLQLQVEEEMERLEFPKEQRKFHPHLTLGRVKIPSHLKGILDLLETYKEKILGEMEVQKMTFFRSVLKPTGAEYSVLSEFEFK